ncbi:tubulin-like protein [Actinomyces bowdenii]|uniref:Tubulin-like protein n=1 Tax=Actinomyces bowdenii TaxID=131109 RepID=A0A3P1VB69_9ACTO|nr:tubulin-like doman-containing protein [Actinomyces bowdenii]MBO3724372.1 tubulin-like protein [Actinomyces bowdenii]RRD30750.1 tubulin-like protein [Actinomyces bowdenii]
MYKVLVIGCGGSGAKTLSYMMDQLHADLAVHGIDEIPGCWQFLVVDTPLQEEQGEQVASVSRQGGAYVACGVANGEYRVVDEGLTHSVQRDGSQGLRQLATWMPRRPRDVAFPVTVGAGQFRGIGRLLVLTRVSEISRGVQGALARMSGPRAQEEAERVARSVPGAGPAPESTAPPLVLVVSSMAGGSGASMTLDVCRLVAGVRSAPAIDPQLISVFLYTAEAFGSVPAHMRSGMPGNTLAMLGEIVAAQASPDGTAADLDASLYSSLGLSNRAGRAFKRVTPIGLRSGGSGAVFGDGTTEGLFRGMGRGLARYISSSAFDDYVSYDIANQVSIPGRDLVAWGVDPTDTAWGSFGYASLSTGRDRYAEYAAQRIARRVVDHSLDGFRLAGDTTGDTQRLADLWGHRRTQELEALGLPVDPGSYVLAGEGAVDQATIDWFLSAQASAVVNKEVLAARAGEAVSAIMAQRPQAQGMPVVEWGEGMARWLEGSKEPALLSELERTSAELALSRLEEMAERLVSTTRRAIAELGLPYALYLLDQLRQPGGILESLVPRVAAIEQLGPAHPLALPDDLTQQMRGMGKATLGSAGTEQLVERMHSSLKQSTFHWLAARTAAHVAGALRDMASSAVRPLEDALDDARKVLVDARAVHSAQTGVADVATEIYGAWPQEPQPGQTGAASVPQRFATAHNEVVLMGVQDYPARFEEHITHASSARSDVHQAYARVVREVLVGSWEQGAGERPPEDLLRVSTAWVPAALHSATGSALPTPARYELRLKPSQILGRARAYVARRGESFETFSSQSLRSYLTDDTVGDHERHARSEAVLTGLKRTLEMARPLAEISEEAYRVLHNGERPALAYTFSPIPLRNQEVVGRFLDYLDQEETIDRDLVRDRVDKALGDEDVSRVDVFGSYPRTLPVAYSGLLKSVAEAWDRARGSSGARDSFWRHRRARPLPGGLPIGDAERRALVRGWWTATLAGGIERAPWGASSDTQPVRIWDPAEGEWVAFPAPMLTPPSRMITANAWLPAVLESILLAYLRVGSQGLEAFRPWRVLRHWADDSSDEPQVSFGVTSPVERTIGELLSRGRLEGLTPVAGLAEAGDPESRRTAMLAYCDLVLGDLEQNYLPGPGKADAPGHFTNYRKRTLVETTPLTIDLAQEMHDELRGVRETIASAQPTIASGEFGSSLSGGIEY